MSSNPNITSVVALSLVCEEDAWLVPQYLAEVERLGMRFVMHFDRCSAKLKEKVLGHKLCMGHTTQDNPRVEHHDYDRMMPYKIIEREYQFHKQLKLFVLWDIDETWDKDAAAKFYEMAHRPGVDEFKVTWLNHWGDTKHVRTDNPSNPYRTKAHRLDTGVSWYWKGPYSMSPYATTRPPRPIISEGTNLVCLNHGLMTRELREMHKERWDRVYGTSLGCQNPYGYWDYLLNEKKHPPIIEEWNG